MAGLACATRLQAHDGDVSLLDKGRLPGGRMSTKRIETPLGEATFDYGAQYFTARDPGFRACVDGWVRDGIVASWPPAGEGAFVGVPGMSEPIRALAASLRVEWLTQVVTLRRAGQVWEITCQDDIKHYASTLVVALPAEQAHALLAFVAPSFAGTAAETGSRPCWTVMVAFDQRLPVSADCLHGHPTLGWAARNTSKPGRSGPESWVLQASPDWSLAHIDDPHADVIAALLRALAEAAAAPIPGPIIATAHRWRYARSGSSGAAALWDERLQLGVCGDWLIGPRVESAWMSGTRLASMICDSRIAPAAG